MKASKEIYKWDTWNECAIEIVDAAIATTGLDKHFHDNWTFGQVMYGQCHFESGGFKHSAPAGSLFIIPPLEVHTSGAEGTSAKYRVAYISDCIVTARMPLLRAFMLSNHQRVWVDSGALVERLCDSIEKKGTPDCDWAKALHFDAPCGNHAENLHTNSELQELIHSSWNQNIDIATIESTVKQSRWQAIRNFKKALGITPGSYLKQLRILKSRHMLSNGESLANTAFNLSFSDQPHYARSFKQVFGVPPGAFRKKIMLKDGSK